ncbi:MAG: hypothetical protein QM754_09710 [Tepidisphaeraceae bacterium]
MSSPLPDDLERELNAAETAALWLWLLGQAGLVALFVGRIKLTSGYPEPIENSADVALACGQVILACLLGYRLLGRRPAAVRAMAAAAVFATLAALLAGRRAGICLHLNLVAGLWLLAIGRISGNAAGRLVMVFLTVAAPVIYYSRLEFGPPPPGLGNASTLFSPTLGIVTTVLHPGNFWPVVVPIVMILVCSTAKWGWKRRRLLRPLQLP